MKKTKRLLALFLAITVAMSVLTVGVTAFAADNGSELASRLMEELWADKTRIDAARPEDPVKAEAYDKKLGLYQRTIVSYKPLTDEQRDSIALETTLRFWSTVIQREAYLIKADYDAAHETALTAAEARRQAQDQMPELLGDHTAREEALSIAKAHLFEPYKDNLKLNPNMKFDCQEAKDAFRSYWQAYTTASSAARKYLDGISNTFFSFSNVAVGGALRDLLKMSNTLYLTGNPYVAPDGSTSAPKNPVSPKPAFGTPEYADWLEGQRANKQWTADKTEYANRAIMADLREVGKLSELANAVAVMLEMNEAYRAFIERDEEEACKIALEAYEKLDAYGQAVVSANTNGAYYYVYLQSSGKDYTYSNLNYGGLYKKCAEVGGMVLVRAFGTWLDGADIANADNALAEEARAEYAKVPAAMKTKIPAESLEKYRAILAKSIYIDEIERKHETFESEKITLDGGLLTGVADGTIIPNLNTILTMLLGDMAGRPGMDLTALLQSFFTNETVTMLAMGIPTAVAPLLGNQASMFNLQPKQLAKQLGEAQFAAVATVLEQYETWEEMPADIALDWGVTDGEYHSFMTAALATLRGLGSGTGWDFVLQGAFKNLFLNKYGTAPGGGADAQRNDYGIYELALLPLFEALGAENVMTTAEYEAKVATSYRIEDFLRPIMDQLYQEVLLKLTADPTGWLLENLPNLLYHLDDGCILGGLSKAMDMEISMVGNLKELLKGLLGEDWSFEGLLNQFLDLSASGISYQDIAKIGKMGSPEKIASKSVLAPDSIRVVADERSVAAYLVHAVNSLVYNAAGIDFTVHGAFVKKEPPQYPHNGKMGKDVMEAMINSMDSLIGGFVNLNDTINSSLCTPEMAANMITGLYGALAGLELGQVGITLPVTPEAVAKHLTEVKYADLKDALSFQTWDDVALVLKNDDKTVYQCDMGFRSGDRSGFVDCITAALRPLVKLMLDAGILVNGQNVEGETTYGLYETMMIPLFEALGVKPAADSVTYTDNYMKLSKKADQNAAYDYLVQTILSPVMNLLDDLATSPVSTLMGLLPNLAYALQYNETTAFVGNLLERLGGLEGILTGLLQNLQTGEDADGNPVYGLKGITLPEINLDLLASCGTLKQISSKSARYETCTAVAADKADVFVTVFSYLYDAMNDQDNMNQIKALLGGIDGMDPAVQSLIDGVLNEVFSKGKEDALCMLGTLLASDVWECPDGESNYGTGTPSTGDDTMAAAAILPVLFAAAAAIVLLRKKKNAV